MKCGDQIRCGKPVGRLSMVVNQQLYPQGFDSNWCTVDSL